MARTPNRPIDPEFYEDPTPEALATDPILQRLAAIRPARLAA